MPGRIVGRDAELRAVGEFLDHAHAAPCTLGLWGEAGIGKTTIWRAGIDEARQRGFTVLACRPASSEVRLSYAGLTDLLSDIGTEAFTGLPRPQRRALDAALLRSAADDPPDTRSVAAGFLSVLDGLSTDGPVLLAVDDLQWMDEPSRRVIAFAARRCCGRIALLWAERVQEAEEASDDLRPSDPMRARGVHVGPLSLAALHAIVEKETGRSLARPVMARVAELSGGNPFFAVEAARTVDERGTPPTTLPTTIKAIVDSRVRGLAPQVREALLVVSALSDAHLDVVGRAIGAVDAADVLAPAEDAGVVELTAGRVRFTHPLLANGVYLRASPTKRRALHRMLSAIVDDVEEHARHLALGSARGESATFDALDAAAEGARRRGAPSAAAELLELAISLGATDPARRIQLARDHFHADNQARAKAILEDVLSELGPGPQRAAALALLGTLVYELDDFGRAVPIFEEALEHVGDDPQLEASTLFELVTALNNSGRMAEALPLTDVALGAAERSGDDGLIAEALGAVAICRFVNGRGLDEVLIDRALSLEDPERLTHAYFWPSMSTTLIEVYTHRYESARERLAAMYQRCVDRGLESDLWIVLTYEALAALPCGDVDAARRAANELTERARMSGSVTVDGLALMMQTLVLAWVGDVDACREIGPRAVEAMSSPPQAAIVFALAALGMLEVSVENHDAAAGWLSAAAAQSLAIGIREPGMVPLLPDAAEALIALERFDEAEPLVELLEANARDHDRPWSAAVAARCRALMLAANGDVDGASDAFDAALVAHDRLPRPYDRARTLLSAGRHQRRRNQRRAARASLDEAARLFLELGATVWAAAARAESERLGTPSERSDRLTPTESRVAVLAASGMTNREVAARLFISAKTVEANLSRAYRKLGIHSRAELGSLLARGDLGQDEATT